jgi:osmotically-inducible protein OsmY
MRGSFLVILTATVALLCSGCASSPTDKQAPGKPEPALRVMGEAIQPGDAVSNEQVGFEIRRRLNNNPGESAGIIVEVDEGNVTLRGVAPNLAAAWRAEAAARSVKGVKQVSNQILVSGSAPPR